MKTPKEILLSHHQAAEPKLHALRKRVLATTHKSCCERTSWLERLANGGRNLFCVPRFAWGGLAAAWLIIIALHFAAHDSAPNQAIALTQNRPSAETLRAVREQKRLLAELTGFSEKPANEIPRSIPRRRSDRGHELIMV